MERVVDALGVGHPVAVDLLHRQQAAAHVVGRPIGRWVGRVAALGLGSEDDTCYSILYVQEYANKWTPDCMNFSGY